MGAAGWAKEEQVTDSWGENQDNSVAFPTRFALLSLDLSFPICKMVPFEDDL